MATNIEQIFRSFVVNKFREIQEEQQQQQQHGGGKVEGQPNGDTNPAEQANPSDDTVAGAGSRQNDQIAQKIEEVLSGALDTELQSKSDVDKTTVSNSTQSTKRSSTAEGEDEIPRKKSKKNKKHKSKKKKKKKKKRKKEKKHKKQPKESKLSTRPGEHVDSQPASHLIPEKSSSTLSVQHGGFGDANLAVHIQPEELSLQANVELDRQALGLASQLRTDSQPCMENLESEKGTLYATDTQFNLEGSQFTIQQNASMTQTAICTREEQIKQAHENICPVAVSVSEKGDFFVTGSVASTSIPSGVANKSELQKLVLPSEVKTLDTSLASNTMEVLTHSDASLKSVALGGAKELETTSESMCLTSSVVAVPKPANQADLNTMKVNDMSVAMGEVRIPGATELPLVSSNLRVTQCSSTEGSSILKAASESVVVMGDVKNKEVDPDAALQQSFRVPAETAVTQVQIASAKTPLAPGTVEVKDIEPVRVSVHVGNVRPLEEVLQPVIKPKTLEAVVKGTSDSATAASEALLQCTFLKEKQSLTDVNVVAKAKGLQTTSEPVVQTLVPQTVPDALQLGNSNVLRGLEATPQSLQKEDMERATSLSLQMESVKASEEPSSGSIEPVMVPEALAEMMHLKTTAERETAHMETVAVPFLASETESCIVSQPEIMTGMRGLKATSQTVFVGERKDFEEARSSTIAEVRSLDSLSEVKAVAEASGAETGSKISCLTEMKNLEMAVGSETRTQMQDWGTTLISEVEDLNKAKVRSKETVEPVQTVTVKTSDTNSKPVCLEELATTTEFGTVSEPNKPETVEHSKTTPGPLQEQVVGNSETILESFPKAEATAMEMRNLKETLKSGIVSTRQTDRGKTEFSSVIDVKGLKESSVIEKGMKAKCLEPASEAGEVRLESVEESAAAEMKSSETVKEPEVHMDMQDLETSQKYGRMAETNVLEDASEALTVTKQHIESVPQYLHAETQEHAQTVLEAKPAEWKSTEEAPEIWVAAEMKSSEAVPKLEDTRASGAMLECEITAEVQYSEGEQCQQMEDTSVPNLSLECEMVAEKKDSEQALPLESFIALSDREIATESGVHSETIFSSSHAANVKDSTGTPESEITRDAKHLEAPPSCVVETKGLEATHISGTVVELKDAEAVEVEADTKDLEAAVVPEAVTEGVPVLVEEASQLEAIPQSEADREVAAEEASETRDSETSDVQPDVAARMRETLMRLEKVIEKSSHRSSEKSKHDAKKQKRSRSKSQSRSRKRKKKSRSRSTSRRLTSKRARSRSRNYSDSRKKHSKSRSRSVEKRERRVSSRRSRRRRSRSSDRYRSKSRSVEKTRRSGRGRSRSSDRYRSKSRSVEKRESRLSSRRSRRRRSRSSDRYRSKSRSAEKRGSRLSSRRSRRGRSRSSDRYRSKSRSAEKSRRSGRRRSRSSDRYRSKSRSVEKTRRSGRRRSRSSDRYRSKSRSVEKTRRSGRRRSRSSDRYRSKSPSVEKRGSRLSSWRSRRRRSRSSDRSKSRSRSSEKRGGKEYSWRFRHRGSGSSDRSKSRSRSVEKRGRKASLRRSKRRRSKSSDRYKSRSRSVEKRDRKQSSRKSKRQRSKSSDRYKSRSKSVEKKKESSRKSKRRRSKSSEHYKSRSRSVEKKRKESSKKSKRKRSKSSDSLKSRSKSVEKRASKLASAKYSRKQADSSEQEKVDGSEPVTSEISSSKSSNGPMSVALSLEGINGPELPPQSGSGFSETVESLEASSSIEKMDGPQPSAIPELDSSKTSSDQEQCSMPVEKTQVSVTPENGSATLYDSDLGSVPVEKTVPLESSSLTELTFSASVSSSVEKRDPETTSVTEFNLSASHQDESRSASLKEIEGPEPLLTNKSGCFVSADDYKSTSTSSGNREIGECSVMSGSVLSDGHELRHIPAENAEPQEFLQVPQSGSSDLADNTESRSLSFETAEVQKPFLAPEVKSSEFLDAHESISLPIAQGQMEVPSLASDSVCFRTPDRPELGSSFGTQIEELPLMSEGTSLQLPAGKVKAASASLTSVCGPVEITVDHISTSSSAKMQVFLTTAGQSCESSEAHESSSSVNNDLDGSASLQVLGVGCFGSSEMPESRHLPAGEIEAPESALSGSGIALCHHGHDSEYSYFEKTEGVDTVESVSTSAERLEATVPCLTSEGGLFVLPDSHELRATQTENVEEQKSSLPSEQKCIASPDEHQLRSPSGKEIQVQEEQPLIVESSHSVSSGDHELTLIPFKKANVEDSSQMPGNEYTVGLPGPELMSTPVEKTEVQELYLIPEERCSVSLESQELLSPAKTEMQEPALTSENEYTVSWKCQELRASSPERVEMQEPSIIPGSECAVYSGDQESQTLPAEKTEVQMHSLMSENEYAASPEGQSMTAISAEIVQEPSAISRREYVAVPREQEFSSPLAEKTEVQECSVLSENEYDISPECHDLRSSPAEKEEMRELSETSESESSVSADDQELHSTAVGKTEVQELSLSEGECATSPEVQELHSSPAEKVESEEPSVTYENEHTVSSEGYESRSTHGDKTEDMNSLTSERDHYLSFKSQEVRFTTVQKVDVQELSPTSESEHTASPDSQELRFLTSGQVGDSEPLTLNDRGSMSPDVSDLKAIPVEKVDDATSLMPESGYSMSPGGNSVKSVPGEETGDLEPSLTSECRHSTSPYHENREVKSPMEEDGLESSVTFEHGRSVTPEGHDEKSVIDEEMEDREPSLTSEHRRSTSPDEHESRSSVGEEVEYSEQPLTMERRSSVSSDEHDSRSTAGEEVEDVEPSLTGKRRDSTSSDERESRSTIGEEAEDRETSLAAERRDSVSSDERDSRSTAGEEVEDLEPLAEHRRSVSPDGCESRSTTGEEAEDQEPSLTAERRHSTSSDERESRSTTGEDVEDVEPSLTAERRDSTSSDEQDSRSTTGEEAEDMELSLTTEQRRSTSPDGRESRSTIGEEGEDAEPSLTAERRDSTSSDDHESRSTTGEEVEDMEPSLAAEDKHEGSPSILLEKSEGQDSSFMTESRRSESSEREKSRSESAEKMSDRESSQRSRSRPSKSPIRQMSRSPSVDKTADEESSRRSRHRRSRSMSVEKAADKESSRRSRHRRSRSAARQMSRSASVEKTADKESSRRSRRRRSRSTARQRSRSKSVDKTADKESSRRSRSRRSRSSQRRSQRYDADSRSRRNRSRSATRRRASRSKSNRRSRSSSLSRSRHRRRSRSRSASRRRRSLSRDRRRRSQRNRSRSADRRRRRSDSRDRRISLRLRSRSRTPLRQRRSRSRGRRRSSSRSPIRLRRSRSSGRRRGYSRSPDRRRSRSSERFSSRSPKRLTDLDKAQLLEIAKANAAAMCAKSGVPLPPSLMPMLSQKKDDKASQKSSRDTLKELTEKCKKIAQSTDDVIVNKPHVSDEEEEERPFYNHPFKLNEPKPIFFNLSTPSIKPAPPPQPKNQVSLSKEFPVSSGSQHRKKEADSVYGEWVPVEKGKEDSKDDVFPKPSIEGVDITAAMNDRALAQKRLNENTFDLEAMCMLNRAQEQIDAWAQSNSIPGQFTGSTGAQILSSDELTNSGPQAWIRKDQFLRAAPVTGGMGAQLMRKMGWREGEGLGKNKEGSVEPIMVDFKTDRKGLVAVGEKAQKRSGHYVVMKDLSGKHPVSALMEICNKRRWSPPEFVLVDDSGPDHRKHFIFKVRVNGNEYRPTFASLNKKHAKATAATAALQAMGLVPKESMVNTTMFRSASHR